MKDFTIEIEHYNRNKEKIDIHTPICNRHIKHIVSNTIKGILKA